MALSQNLKENYHTVILFDHYLKEMKSVSDRNIYALKFIEEFFMIGTI
jgi:energy-coupling factor transporter ATP-binding protein EcfA2